MKKIFLIISVVAFTATFNSCLFHEEQIFEGSAAERLAQAARDNLENFQSASNGWEMHYFPTNSRTGHVLLVRFDEDGFATMMGRNFTTGNVDSIGRGMYSVEIAETVKLTFNTRNPIIHAFSDPDQPPRGFGIEGDFEFLITSNPHTNPDVIQMRGKKRNTLIELRRLPENQDWSDYFDQVDEMRNYLLGNNPLLAFNVENARFNLANGRTGIFNLFPFGGGGTTPAGQVPFLITNTGIVFVRDFVVRENSVRRFILNGDSTQLVAADVNFDSKIQAAEAVDVFIDNVNFGNRYQILRKDDENMSADVNAIYTMIENRSTALRVNLIYVGFVNHRTLGTSLALQVRGANTINGYLGLDISKVGNNEVSFAFTGEMDNNGRNFYNNFDVPYFIAMLEADTYTVSFQDGGFAPTIFRLTSKNNPNIWFDLFFR